MKTCLCLVVLACASCETTPLPPVVAGIIPGSTTRVVSGNPGPKIAAYCRTREGSKVGNGECWTPADEAFKSAGARRPGLDMRVWGREVDPARERLKAGDVIEFQNARFSNGTITGSAHTAVVVGGGPQSGFTIAEQNWGRKTVRIVEMDLTKHVSGKVRIYRPG